MKKTLLALWLALCSLLTLAQNGGQYSENPSIRLEYAGAQGSTFYVRIVNKKTVQITVKVDYAGQFTNVTIPASGTYMWPLGTSLVINAKNLDCGGNDCGWVELCITSLPAKFTQFTCEHISGDDYLIKFTIAEAKNVKQFNVQLSIDGKTYNDVALTWPDELQPNKQYQLKIKIKR